MRLWIVAVVGVVLVSYAADPFAADSRTELAGRVEAYVRPYAQSNNFSGCVLVATGDVVDVRQCWGMANEELRVPNTPRTRFHIASVSKSFTAAAILRLEDEGRLAVGQSVASVLPGYPRGGAITIHDLLAHRSGIPNVNDLPDYERRSRDSWTLPEIVSWFQDLPLEFEPGSRYRYSNSNYNLLAHIIERVTGQRYGDYLLAQVCRPAGLRETGHDGRPQDLVAHRAAGYLPVSLDGFENAPFLDWSIKTGNGSLYSTVDDLHRWVQALVGGRVLNPASTRKMFADHRDGAGYGWSVRGGDRPSVSVTGRSPGFSSSVEHFTRSRVTVVVTANLYSSIAQTIAADLGAIAHGETRRALVPVPAMRLDPAVAARLVGRWRFGPDFSYNPNMLATVRIQDGALTMEGSGGAGTAFLIPVGTHRFVDRLYGGTVRFVVDETGRATALVWNFGTDYVARRADGSEPAPARVPRATIPER